jgi:hypothetical protein
MYSIFKLSLLPLELAHFLFFPPEIILAQWRCLVLFFNLFFLFFHKVSIAIKSAQLRGLLCETTFVVV